MASQRATKVSELLKKIERLEDEFGCRGEMPESSLFREKNNLYMSEITRLRSDLNKKNEILSRMAEDGNQKMQLLEDEKNSIREENEKLRDEIETLKNELAKISVQAKEFANWRKDFLLVLHKKEDIIDTQSVAISGHKNTLKQYEDEIRRLNLKLTSLKIVRNEKKSVFSKIIRWLNYTHIKI